MATITTLTTNPALDVSTGTPRVEPTEKLRCAAPSFDPGGGGLNVARVVGRLGGSACAVYPRGGPAGSMLDRLLEREGIGARPVPIAGATRESFTVDEEDTGRQFRFVMPGPTLDDAEERALLAALEGGAGAGGLLVLSGSLALGLGDDFYARVCRAARDRDARVVVDSSGPPLARAAEEGAFLIKPNRWEFARLTGIDARAGDDELAEEALRLVERGRVRVVVVSLGGDGALLAADGRHRFFRPPAVEVVSAVGAGDSLVGALVTALDQGWDLDAAVCYGIAAGTAALATPGTELCRRSDVDRLYAEMCG